jgi:hypothetical protein
MALDTTVYKLLALQDLARRGELTRRGKLPSIFTLVFYTGEAGWHAPTSLLDLVEEVPGAPEGVDLWSYVLVDAQRQPLEELLGSDSPLVALFRLERLKDPEELPAVALELDRILNRPDDQGLVEAFVALINEAVLRKLSPADGERVRITGLKEVQTVLAQRMERIAKSWETQGWEKGWEKGREKGRKEGQKAGLQKGLQEGRKQEAARLFERLFEAKFGDVPAWVHERAAAASKTKLEKWAKRLLVAEEPEAVFED